MIKVEITFLLQSYCISCNKLPQSDKKLRFKNRAFSFKKGLSVYLHL